MASVIKPVSCIGFGSGESHQSSVLRQIPANEADCVQVHDTESRSTKNDQRSFADAGSIGSGALSESAIVAGSFSAQQTVAGCHSPRARTVLSDHEEASMRARTGIFVALPQPSHATQAAADPVAAHRALDSPNLSIEGARTCATSISARALPIFRAFQPACSSSLPLSRVIARARARRPPVNCKL